MHPRDLDIMLFWKQGKRYGVTAASGASLGMPEHNLKDVFPSIVEASVKRHIYPMSEGARLNRVQLLKDSIWHERKFPLQVIINGEHSLIHDFSMGYDTLASCRQHVHHLIDKDLYEFRWR